MTSDSATVGPDFALHCRGSSLFGPATHDEIDRFLEIWKPSSHKWTPDGWIWVRYPPGNLQEGQSRGKTQNYEDRLRKMREEGEVLIQALVERLDKIKATAPQKAKTGQKSQGQLNCEVRASFIDDIKSLAQRHSMKTGKWMYFIDGNDIDRVWSKIVKALADGDGPLAKTGVVSTAKVAASPNGRGGSHLICVYVNDSWNLNSIEKVFKALRDDCGLLSKSYKCDAYTHLGINTGHATGISPILYKNTDFMTKTDIEESDTPAKQVTPKKRTLEDEQELGLADLDPVASDEA